MISDWLSQENETPQIWWGGARCVSVAQCLRSDIV